jgi:hypothetical protein
MVYYWQMVGMAKEIKIDSQFHGSKISVVLKGDLPNTPLEIIDEYLKELKANQKRWAQDYPIRKRIELLVETLKNIETYKDEWVKQDLIARHIPPEHWDEGNSAIAGPGISGRITRVFIGILDEIENHGGNESFAKARQDGDRVIVEAFPRNIKEKLLLPNVRGEIHLAHGTKVEDITLLQAATYKDRFHVGGVSLVLGAGNISTLTINDTFQKLFVEKEVVIIKANPVLEYLGPLLNKVLEPFIREGFVRIINGGAKEGIYVANHPLVDNIHITGSDKSFEAIVYGRGEEGQKNKELDHRLNPRPVSAELGNVTPVIVVPGDWKESDFDYQADNIFSMLAPFNGYACTAMRVLILPKFWNGSQKLLEKLEEKMSKAKPATNYYPGTNETVSEAMACYPNADIFGKLDHENQPWIMAKDLDAKTDEMAFDREFWAAFTTQTYIEGVTREEYLANAVKFANEKLWGTLSAAIVIDAKTEKEMTENGSLTKAIDDLHYGTVALNIYPGFNIMMATTPWGGYPGATYNNIQSGNGFVSNALMLDKIEKSVIFAPFIIKPKPIWFISDKPNIKAATALMNFAISNKIIDFGRVLMSVIRH